MSLQYIRLEGNLFTSDHLARVQAGDKELGGLTAKDYEVRRRLDDEVSEAYNKAEAAWQYFKLRKRVASNDPFDVTHDWISDLWKALGGGPLPKRPAPQIEGKEYPIRYEWEGVPIHIVSHSQDLEKGPRGDARGNPHSTLQEYVNRHETALWGILTNGLSLRILRDNANSTRPAYIEFDLKGMMEAQSFAEFGLFWRMCHHTRFLRGQDCWLEKWMHESANRGTPARDLLRGAVENALITLGRGFLRHPKNKALRQRLQKGELTPDEYYRQLLRLVYRLIFLFVTEDRGLLLQPDAPREAKARYAAYYSTQRLRKLAQSFRGTRHHDLYEGIKVVMDGLKDSHGKPALALPPLNSDLWSRGFIPDLDPPTREGAAESGFLENRDLLSAVHDLSRIRLDGGEYRTVDYRNLGSDELGSIYESLLELEPRVDVEGRSFRLVTEGGGERKTTGSHYTPQSLIDEVLDHALEPLLDEAEKAENPEKAILELTVCDPTCGSGHFLIAAAHRMAKRLARLRTGDPEPAPGDLRHALRDVISGCIYGVDINPMSVELCKVSLWLEAMEPGKPLAYLEHHIKCGNALLGASPEYVERGIPAEAYTPRPNIDDKDTCKQLVKINRDFPMNATSLENFRNDRMRVADVLSAALDRIEQMPTSTVGEVEAKDAEYRRTFAETDEYDRYKLTMDAWCAAFSYEKQPGRDQKRLTNVELIEILHADAQTDRETMELIRTEQIKERNRFFHWQLEFPSIFRYGGFHAVLGNPPYLGGSKVSGQLGHHYNNFLNATHLCYNTSGDLAGAFLLAFARIRRPGGRIGVITTNSISKGQTRTNALTQLLGKGMQLAMVRRDAEWPGAANVIVSVLVLCEHADAPVLNGEVVDKISSRLDPLPETEVRPIEQRRGLAFKGDMPGGTGFLIPANRAREWTARNSHWNEVLQPYLTAEDLLQAVGQAPGRWAICFHDWPEVRARTYRELFEIVERDVKPQRLQNNRALYRENWWKFSEYRKTLHEILPRTSHVIVRAMVSETPLFLRVSANHCFSNLVVVLALDDWTTVGILNSQIHEIWYRKQGGGMKQDLRYTPSTCFETFPLPIHQAAHDHLGKTFHDAILGAAEKRGIALTPFWNLVNSPECNESDVRQIRSLRDRLTEEVAATYDLKIDFRFGHYKDHANRWRYTMHPEAAEQVYLALVELNAEQAAEERARPQGARPKLAKGQAKLVGQKQTRLGE